MVSGIMPPKDTGSFAAPASGGQQVSQVISAAHGLVALDSGKPIGWRGTSTGKPYVWTDTATTEYPVAILSDYIDADTIEVAACGAVIIILDSLLPSSMPVDGANNNSRLLYWDKSAGKYVHSCPVDSVVKLEALYWLGPGATAGTSYVMSLLPGRPVDN